MYGDGSQTSDFILVDHVVKANLVAIDEATGLAAEGETYEQALEERVVSPRETACPRPFHARVQR